MNTNQIYPVQYQPTPYGDYRNDDGNEERFLPFLAGLAITAPFWAGGFGRRCCYPFPAPTPFPYPYPLPTPYPFPYGGAGFGAGVAPYGGLGYGAAAPYTFNTYQGVVGSPYSYYYGRPYPY